MTTPIEDPLEYFQLGFHSYRNGGKREQEGFTQDQDEFFKDGWDYAKYQDDGIFPSYTQSERE